MGSFFKTRTARAHVKKNAYAHVKKKEGRDAFPTRVFSACHLPFAKLALFLLGPTFAFFDRLLPLGHRDGPEKAL